MARTLRGRTTGADNISVGQASGQERTIAGAVPPAEVVGAGSNIAVGQAFPTAVIADDQQVGVTTMLIERRG